MNRPTRQTTVAGALAERGEAAQQHDVSFAAIEQKVNDALGWFTRVVPAHVNPEQYVALAVGVLRKDRKLAAAAMANPASLMVALSDCARMGLIPGETYHLTHFGNTKTGVRDIVGIVDYAGEIDMMYRSGGVQSVHCEVVRRNDAFRWQPGMILPEHEIADDGLASDEERGPLRAVYAYARLTTGGISQVAVLSKDTVMGYRGRAKTMDFWGPAWPAEGDNTVAMWRKTAIHRLWNWVPHSSEFIAERLRASAAAAHLSEQVTSSPAAALPSAPPGPPALGNGGDGGGPFAPGEAGRHADALSALDALLAEVDLAPGTDDQDRHDVVGALVAAARGDGGKPVQVPADIHNMGADDLEAAAVMLRRLVSEERAAERDPRAGVRMMAEAYRQATARSSRPRRQARQDKTS